MSALVDPEPDGATPLDADELADLIPTHIATRAELNAWEQANIAQAAAWLAQRRRRLTLDIRTLRTLHRRMFDGTWRWAGQFRRSDKNIGIHWPMITTALANLVTDVSLWISDRVYHMDECATRFHHRLVAIHPFPNGNGRHARMFVNRMLTDAGRPVFSWGSVDLDRDGDARCQYIVALRAADAGDIAPLLGFVRS